MRWLVLSILLAACGHPAPEPSSPPAKSAPEVAVVPSAIPAPAPPTVPARWEHAEGTLAFVRTEGPDAKPIVLKGTVTPRGASSNMIGCGQMFGARRSTGAMISVRGPGRDVFVFARARGPFGVAAGSECAVVRPNAWAMLRVSVTDDPIEIAVADADVEGERRGQTSPYVLVIQDDDHEPSDEPAPRLAAATSDTTVRWDVAKVKCEDGRDYGQCYSATLVLGGAYKKRVPMGMIWGQSICTPEGTGIMCGGPSGQSNMSVALKGETLTVTDYSVSDGYCPPPEECGSSTLRAKAKVRAGLHLVADPEGTFPPP